MGVPQGSVIAPLLFNIVVHDVVTAVTGKVVITMYAVDLAIWLDTHIRRLYLESCSQEIHELVSGSGGRGGTVYEGERVYLVQPQNCIHPLPHKQSPQSAATCQDQRGMYLCFTWV